jgi:TolB-like protein/tetratricopeptide (TPR) repeat protein
MSLFNELKRRNVFKVAVAYVIVSWLILQVVGSIVPIIEAPEWVSKAILIFLLAGFPIALLFAWAFELTPEGVKKESEVDRSKSTTEKTSSKINTIIIVSLVLIIGGMIFERLTLKESEVNSKISDEVTNLRSIAVLPFLNLSSQKDHEYFSDGLTDTILHKLAQLPDLRVAARTSSFKFKGQNKDMRDIASQLGVATVLEGSVQRQGNKVRITAQLIKGSDGSHIWSKVFDDTLDDIFRVQDEIAVGVATAMRSSLTMNTGVATEIGGTKILTAYEAYLKGIDAARKGTPEGVNLAISQLELAVEIDPNYALAWAALSSAYYGPARLGTATWESTYEPMRKAAKKAMSLEPNLAVVQLAMASAIGNSDVLLQRKFIEKAVALEPNNADALVALAQVKMGMDQYREALKLTEQAKLINPLDNELNYQLARVKLTLGLVDESLALMKSLMHNNPDDMNIRIQYADLLLTAGHIIESAKVDHQSLEMNPDLLSPLFNSFFMRLMYGDPEKAETYLRRVEVLSPGRAFDDRAEFCLLTGNRACHEEYAARYLTMLRKTGTKVLADLYEGVLWIYRGNPKKAIKLLKPRLDNSLQENTLAYDLNSTLYLAIAHARNGDTINRDRILSKIEATTHRSLANGLWPRLVGPTLVEISAVRGDAKMASERLINALENNYYPSWFELNYYAIYEDVRDAPEFQKQMLRVKQAEKKIREEIIAEGIW